MGLFAQLTQLSRRNNSLVAGLAVAIVIGGQLLLEPKTFAVIAGPSAAARAIALRPKPSASSIEDLAVAPRPISNRSILLFNGQVNVPLSQFPLVGNAQAKHLVGYLFDYTCHECHHLHQLLNEAVEHYNGSLATACIPVPFHSSCNPAVNCPGQERVQACSYARLAFAVWLAGPDKYEKWNQYVSEEMDEAKPFGLALVKAKELTDLSQYKLNGPDQILDAKISACVQIYRAAGLPDVPALIFPGGILRGHVPDKATLIGLLDKLVVSRSS